MVITMAYTNNLLVTRLMTLFRLSLILMMLAFFNAAHAADDETEQATGFDHFATGFPLIGRHELIDCSDCHIAGQFKGTPMECGLCHNGVRAPGKHLKHLPSSNFCDDCHTDRTWLGARFDHIDVHETCLTCHDNSIAIGKSPSHILISTPFCEDCHNTISFDHVGKVDHASVSGDCSFCHNGVIATGKPAEHPQTTDECNSCHTVFTWDGADDD
jgi:hypothetical protein